MSTLFNYGPTVAVIVAAVLLIGAWYFNRRKKEFEAAAAATADADERHAHEAAARRLGDTTTASLVAGTLVALIAGVLWLSGYIVSLIPQGTGGEPGAQATITITPAITPTVDLAEATPTREVSTPQGVEKWDSYSCRIYRQTGKGVTGILTGDVRSGEVAVLDAWRIESLWTGDGPWFYVERQPGTATQLVTDGALCIGPEDIAVPARRQACPFCQDWPPGAAAVLPPTATTAYQPPVLTAVPPSQEGWASPFCRIYLETGVDRVATLSDEVRPGEVAVVDGWSIPNLKTGDGPWYSVSRQPGVATFLVVEGALCIGPESVSLPSRRAACPSCREWTGTVIPIPSAPRGIDFWYSAMCHFYDQTGQGVRNLSGNVLPGEVAIFDGWRIESLETGDGPWFYVERQPGTATQLVTDGALCIGPEVISLPARREACPACNEWH